MFQHKFGRRPEGRPALSRASQHPVAESVWTEDAVCCRQVAQVLLTLPTSFAQMGLASGVAAQLLYALMGCWAAYLMNTLYLEYRNRKEKENANFKNHVIQVSECACVGSELVEEREDG